MTDIELIWEEPPARVRAGGRARLVSEEIREILKEHPGDWAIIATTKSKATLTAWRSGKSGFEPVGAWEFAASPEEDQYKIYARYVGE